MTNTRNKIKQYIQKQSKKLQKTGGSKQSKRSKRSKQSKPQNCSSYNSDKQNPCLPIEKVPISCPAFSVQDLNAARITKNLICRCMDPACMKIDPNTGVNIYVMQADDVAIAKR